MKLKTGGSFKEGSRKAGCVGVIRESSGKWLSSFVANLGSAGCVLAEVWGLSCGLEMDWRMGFKKIILEIDITMRLTGF